MPKLNSKKTVAYDEVTCLGMACKILKKVNGFGNENRITSGNFNAITLRLVEKFDNPVSHFSYSLTY